MASRLRSVVCVLVFVVACDPTPWGDLQDASSVSERATPPPPLSPSDVAPSPALVLDDAEQAALDPRAWRTHPRPSRLIVTELRSLQSLAASTPAGSPDRPALLRRIADDYAELAESVDRDAARLRLPSAAPPETRRDVLHSLRSIERTARTAAIMTYTMLLRLPSSDTLDDARWYLALEDARAGRVDDARRAARDVLAHSPHSLWAARARFLLGVELAGEPGRRELAERMFEAASRSDDGAIARVALRRLGRDAPAASPLPPSPPPADVGPPPVARAGAPPAPAACTMDMDCDGVSVCRGGRCVEP